MFGNFLHKHAQTYSKWKVPICLIVCLCYTRNNKLIRCLSIQIFDNTSYYFMKINDKQISSDEQPDKPSNQSKNSLTPELLRTYKGCEHYTDAEAAEVIQSLEKLSAICYSVIHQSNIHSIDNQ